MSHPVQYLNFLCVPCICVELAILGLPQWRMNSLLCACLDWACGFLWTNCFLKSFCIALMRSDH